MEIFIYILAFILSFIAAVIWKLKFKGMSTSKKYSVKWDDSVGKMYTDIPYGEKEANKFDLYVPADNTKKSYGLVVYLHPGGFTTGDKKDDVKNLQWLCSLGYVSAGINYTLFGEKNPGANVYTQSVEIRESIPYVIAEAAKLGYNIDEMVIAGGSAGHALAMIYAYRDADTSPVPVRMVYGGVGPSCYYTEDWKCFGCDKNPEAGVGLFSIMSGNTITVDMIGTPEYDEAIKCISPALWIKEGSVPCVAAYGKYDKMQSFEASIRLHEALEKYNVPHEYIVCEHSGHGLQNDSKQALLYMEKTVEYLNRYMPVR